MVECPSSPKPPHESFAEALASGRFLVTTEEPPPKGTDLTRFRKRAAPLRGVVDAVNLTESSGAVMTMSPAALVPCLLELGLHPILQMTCRDRNRIALQADLLAAAALGVQTVSCMSGDPIADGDDPDATPVHDLDTPVLLRMAAGLNAGADLTGHALRGRPQFCLGAMVNPGAEDLDREIGRMEQKAEAGANFFQTQSTYDPLTFERFVARADRLRVPILAGYILPKSGEMARRMNRSLPGVRVPDEVIARLDAAPSNVECAIELSVPILKRLAAASQGLHVIAVGWESRLPQILDAAAITRTTE